jgi:hypothetical protein
MPVAARLATPLPRRLEWHPARGDPEAADPETFHLHVEFVNAHGLPQGQFTTFSTCNQTEHVASDTSTAFSPTRTALQALRAAL